MNFAQQNGIKILVLNSIFPTGQHQMMLEDRIHPNGDLLGLSHSQTLPHSLSHHIKSKSHSTLKS